MIDFLLHILGWTINILLIVGLIGVVYKTYKSIGH